MPAAVALAADYGILPRAIFVAICGSMAEEGRAFGAASGCEPSPGSERYPAAAGQGEDCFSGCLCVIAAWR
jgi:hypothetical protein